MQKINRTKLIHSGEIWENYLYKWLKNNELLKEMLIWNKFFQNTSVHITESIYNKFEDKLPIEDLEFFSYIKIYEIDQDNIYFYISNSFMWWVNWWINAKLDYISFYNLFILEKVVDFSWKYEEIKELFLELINHRNLKKTGSINKFLILFKDKIRLFLDLNVA